MSQENVDLIRAVVGAYRDPEIMRALAEGTIDLSRVDADVEWDASALSALIPDLAGVYHGHEGVRTFWRRWFDAWSDLEFEIEDIRGAGDDVVVLIRNQRQLGRLSKIWTDLPPVAHVYTVRRGKLVRWQMFPDHESALERVSGVGRDVEIVRRAVTALNERDVDGYLACCAEDVQLFLPNSQIDGAYEGSAGVRRFLADVQDAGPDFRLEVEHLESFTPELILASLRATASGRTTGIDTDLQITNVYELADGKIRRVRVFRDREEALEATGMRD